MPNENPTQRIEELIAGFDSLEDPKLRPMVVELVQVLMDLHGKAFHRLVEIARAETGGSELVQAFARDELVGQLLVLYDLHPAGLEQRVLAALDSVRPLLHSHGGDVELLSVENGIVRLRLEGSCHGCPSSQMTLKSSIETALYEAAPDMAALEVEGLAEEQPAESGPPASGFVPLESLALDR